MDRHTQLTYVAVELPVTRQQFFQKLEGQRKNDATLNTQIRNALTLVNNNKNLKAIF
jgi:hypothetical protein